MSEEIEELLKGDELTVRDRIVRLYGERGRRALRLADRGRVYMIRFKEGFSVWIVEGRRGDYLVMPRKFCSCDGFVYTVFKGVPKPCYHLIAQAFAERFGFYRVVKPDEEAVNVVKKYLCGEG